MFQFIKRIFGYDTEYLKLGGAQRSPMWEAKKKEFEKTHPKVCAVCGRTKNIQLHHIAPFHLHPELELESNNLTWLCENNKDVSCHLVFGHFMDFRTKYNPDIRTEAPIWLERLTK